MTNRLNTYFDSTKVGRRDYFRQLIFLTFVPLSILLFGLHLVGSYGLTIKPALACSACYVFVSAVSRLSGNLVGISINLCKSIQKELFINDAP